MDLSKLHKDSELLRVYELFGKEDANKNYYAIHLLNRLYLDYDKTKEVKEIQKIVKPFLSEFTIHPYLMLEKLTDSEEKEVINSISNDITKNLFSEKKFSSEIIKRVEYPSLDMNFMKTLLHTITRERRDEKFQDSKKARELFLYYADKNHLGIVLDQLELHSSLYHRYADSGMESDD